MCGLHDGNGSEIPLTLLHVHDKSRAGKLESPQHHSRVLKKEEEENGEK
jgi:hypothetical protein